MVTTGSCGDFSCEAVLCFLVCACVCLSAVGRGTAPELCSHCQCKLWGTHGLSSPSEDPVLSSVPQLSLLWVSHTKKICSSLQLLHQLRVGLEELLEHKAVILPHELLAGELHALLQAPHVLQHAVQGHCGEGSQQPAPGSGRAQSVPRWGLYPPWPPAPCPQVLPVPALSRKCSSVWKPVSSGYFSVITRTK